MTAKCHVTLAKKGNPGFLDLIYTKQSTQAMDPNEHQLPEETASIWKQAPDLNSIGLTLRHGMGMVMI